MKAREVVAMDAIAIPFLEENSLIVEGCPDDRLDRIYVRVERVGSRGYNGFFSLPPGCGAAAVPLTISPTIEAAVEKAKEKAEALLKQRYPRNRPTLRWEPIAKDDG
jgi:hypothetical protein